MLLNGILILCLLLAVLQAVLGNIWLLPVYFLLDFLGTIVAAFLFLLVACQLVDKEKEQTQDSKFFRVMAKQYVDLVIRLVRLQVNTKGLEKLPEDGRFLLVCNHIHDLDPAILLHCFPDAQLAFIAKRETRDYFLIGAVLHKLQCQLINRENDKEALKSIIKCIQIIKEDKASIAVFPEGYVSLDGKLRHFRSGVLKIAQKAGVPIVVCTLQGTKQVLPKLAKLQRAQVDVHLVDVISAEEVKSSNTVELAEVIYEKMITDIGEMYRSDEKAMHPDLQRARMEQQTEICKDT